MQHFTIKSPRSLFAIVSMIFACFLLIASSQRPRLTLWWRKARHSSAMSPNLYEAPTYNCDSPDVVEGSYFVFLHKGCTLEQHKWTIGMTFESNLVFESPENYRFGPLYCVRDIGNADLQKIRADIAVDLVECNRYIPDDPIKGVVRNIYPDAIDPDEEAL